MDSAVPPGLTGPHDLKRIAFNIPQIGHDPCLRLCHILSCNAPSWEAPSLDSS